MKLKDVEFANVFTGSGLQNFFGDGWWYHKHYKRAFPGFNELENCTFVAKTTTFDPREGNMPLKENLQPKKLLPSCIKVYPLKGVVLNSVGLSGPGAINLFAANKWQQIEKPFFISFMAVKEQMKDRIKEAQSFAKLLKKELPNFKSKIGLQVNMSCPNTGHSTKELSKEAELILGEFSSLGIPIDLKVNTFFNSYLLKEIEEKNLCDIVTISNTLPYGTYNNEIDWQKLLMSKKSPLEKYGGGGLSGKTIFPIVIKKIMEINFIGINLPIKGSGGIMSAKDVELMKSAGASAIEFSTAAMIRPWRVKEIINKANEIF